MWGGRFSEDVPGLNPGRVVWGHLDVSGGRLLLLLNRTCLLAGIWKAVHTAFSVKAQMSCEYVS